MTIHICNLLLKAVDFIDFRQTVRSQIQLRTINYGHIVNNATVIKNGVFAPMYVMQFISNESICNLVFTFTCQSVAKKLLSKC